MDESLISDIILELTTELEDDDDFNANILANKVRNAYREVQLTRNYPKYYTEDMIQNDMKRYYSHIQNIARYDYNLLGVEGQSSNTEGNDVRVYYKRERLFIGVIPLCNTK